MNVFVEQAKVMYPGHSLHGKKFNVLIKNGMITSLDQVNHAADIKLNGEQLILSPGWVDIGTHSGEPGLEHRETLESLSLAACAGGYTTLAIFPNTKPPLHSKSEIEFIRQKSKDLLTELIPIGAISKGNAGKELAEMIDMHTSGAIAFSDGKYPVQDTGVMMRAMMYAKHFDGLIINQPQDDALASLGQMHEGNVSQRLGLKGIPDLAETIMLQRDIQLAQYCNTKLLSHLISSEKSLGFIKKAKKDFDKIYTSVSYLNLIFSDQALESFDSMYKQSPPLRNQKDQRALIKAIEEDLIDIICTNHRPLEVEKKDLEFAYAAPGTIGLQTCFAAIHTEGILTTDDWIQRVAINPRKVLGLEQPEIKIGATADLTLFDTKSKWTFKTGDSYSKSINSPFFEKEFTGKVVATFNKGKGWVNT